MFARICSIFLLLCSLVTAQSVKVANYSSAPFTGWKRATVDQRPAHNAGTKNGEKFVLGRQTGRSVWAVDLWLTLQPGEERTLDLATFEAFQFRLKDLPMDPLSWFGGPMKVNGEDLLFESFRIDGAAITSEVHRRIGKMLSVRVWVTWYPDQPLFGYAEAVVCASNPEVPDMGEISPDIRITFGDSIAWVPGKGINAPIVSEGTRFADGQARVVPFTFLWLKHVTLPTDFAAITPVAEMSIGAIGIRYRYPEGNPPYPPSNLRAWVADGYRKGFARLHTWEPGFVGPASNGPQAGEQEDQTFRRHEPLTIPGAEIATLLASYKMGGRPCHHLKANGRQIDTKGQEPFLAFWDGRVHPSSVVSPNRLGKPRNMAPEQDTRFQWASGQPGHWFGPDVEHALVGTQVSAARFTASYAAQWEIAMQARVYMLQCTTRPGWSTSHAFAARATGWEGILAADLFENLEDRVLAEALRVHAQNRLSILVDELNDKPYGVWDPRPSLIDVASGPGWMPWQQSIGAYGLWLMGKTFGNAEAVQIAIDAARVCVDKNWIRLPGENRYRSISNQSFPPVENPEEVYPKQFFNGRPTWYELTWDVPAIFLVKEAEPQNAKAQALWNQVFAESNGGGSWFPPTK